MDEFTPFPVEDELGYPTVPIITIPREDHDLEEVVKGLDVASKILAIASIPAAVVPGLPEVLGLMKGGLDICSTILGFKVKNDKAKAEISVIQNATARIKKCEAAIDKQTEDLGETLLITDKSMKITTQNEQALFTLLDTLNKAYTHSLLHFDTISKQLSQVLANIESMKYDIIKSIDIAVVRIEEVDKRLKTQQIASRLNTVCNFFFAEAKLIVALPLEQRVVKLEQTPGIFNFIDITLSGSNGNGILPQLLNDIIGHNHALPNSLEDNLGFAMLGLLCYGINLYAYILLFQMQQLEVLAQSYYEKGDLVKFKHIHLKIATEFNNLSDYLIGHHRTSDSILNRVLVILKTLHIYDNSDQYKPFANAEKGYANLRTHILSIRDKFDKQPIVSQLDARLYFDFSHIETPINEWKVDSEVMYAMQLLGDDAASSTEVSGWSNAWPLHNLANPVVRIGTESHNLTRVIFRKIGLGKPKIVAYMSNSTMFLFNDVNRDLLDSAYEPNKKLALQNVKRYIEQGVNVNVLLEHNRRAIHGAAETDNWQVASELIKNGSYIDVQTDEGYTPLYIASKKGYHDFVSNLIDHGADANMATTNATHRLTALHVAVLKGHAKIVKLLLNATSVNVNAPSVEGFTPLHYVATFNQEEAASVLLAEKRVNISAESYELKLTPLHLAAIHNSDKVAKLLIDIAKDQIKAKAVEDSTPLHLAAIQGSRKVVQILLDNGASLTDKLSDNTTPLHMAAFNGDVGTISKLLDKIGDKDIDSKNAKGLTPLYLAYQNNNIKAAKILDSSGAKLDVETDGKSLLHLAAQYGHLTAVKNLLNAGLAVTSEDNANMTPLNYAVNNNFIEIINVLLKHGANVDCLTTGRPLVHTLVDQSEDDALGILKVLVIYGVNIDSADRNTGNSFFEVVCENGFLTIANYLYQHMVDINHKNDKNKTALDLAKENGHNDVVKFLEKIGVGKENVAYRGAKEAKQFDGQKSDLVQDRNNVLGLSENKVTRQRREVAEKFNTKQVTSAAGRPYGLINHAIESFVSTMKLLPTQMSNLVTFRLNDNSNAHSSVPRSAFPSVQSTDPNSTLLLLDVLIRKHTGQQYVNSTMTHSDTPLESRLNALELVEQLQEVLQRLAHQSGQKVVELDWFGVFRKVERLMFSAQYDKIESLVYSTARNAFAHDKIDNQLLQQMVNKLLMETRGQNSDANMAGFDSISNEILLRVDQTTLTEFVDVHKQNLI